MASLEDWEVVDKLGPGFAILVLGLVATVVTKSFWQLTGQRYLWFVGAASAVAYALVFAFYLRKPCAGLPFTHFMIVQVFAILMVWWWLDAAFRIINCGLDRSTPSDVAAQVVGFERIKAANMLKLSAPPLFNDAGLVVDTDAYTRAHMGAPVVVTWHKGALGEGWCGRDPARVEASRALR